MKRLLLIWLFCSIYYIASAHPPIGLVYDGKNTIYYSDLNHIWKLDTNTGLAIIYKENIHSHQLFLDKQGNLYGEHYWYLEPEGKFQNYIWRSNKDGIFQKVINDLDGENTDFSFVRDTSFNGYTIKELSNKFQIVKSDLLSSEVWHTLPLRQPNW